MEDIPILVTIYFRKEDQQLYKDLKIDAKENKRSLSRVIISHLSYALNSYGMSELLCERCKADLVEEVSKG